MEEGKALAGAGGVMRASSGRVSVNSNGGGVWGEKAAVGSEEDTFMGGAAAGAGAGAGGSQGEEQAGPARYFLPRYRMPFNSINMDLKHG